ncbi:MAG: hypothetical protein J4G09_08710, partial [Proteobacteria bacterium]|nr:hypothetical protein [Pseudomonadota bacterium]
IGLIAGINVAGQAERIYWLPGVRIALDLPGFAFANLDVSGYLQGSSPGPDEDDAYQIDFNWALPFELGAARFSLEGHVEYIRGAGHDAGGRRASWVLAQPQLRLDLGQLLFDRADRLFLGIEYQYWRNKLGDADTDESVAQALLVWRL